MNYGPYMGMPYMNMASSATKGGLFSKLFGSINFGSILTNTQRTLNIVNQAIPVIKQVQPVIKNAKTMFKVMNEFKRNDTPNNTTNTKNINNQVASNNTINNNNDEPSNVESTNGNGPTFFM